MRRHNTAEETFPHPVPESRQVRRAVVLFGVIGMIIIPVITLQIALQADVLSNTMSMVGNRMNKMVSFILWGVLSAVYFLLCITYLFSLSGYGNRFIRRLVYVTCAMMLCTVLLPSLPEEFPILSGIHYALAVLFPTFILIILLCHTRYLRRYDRMLYRKSSRLLITVILGIAGLLFYVGICSLTEALVAIMLCTVLFAHLIWLQPTPGGTQTDPNYKKSRPFKQPFS